MSWTDQEVRDLFREAHTGTGGCPPAETLARAVSGDLAREAADQVADHLVECADCAEDAQSLRTLEPWADRAALADRPAPGRRTREIAARRWAWHQPLTAVAAGLLVATLGLTGGLLHVRAQGQEALAALQAQLQEHSLNESELRAEVQRLRARPDAPAVTVPAADSGLRALPNVAIVDLLPAGATRGSGAAPEPVPAGSSLVVGVLTVPGDTPAYSDYVVEVRHDGRLAYRGQGFVRSRDDTFTIALPTGLLGRGENRILLLGLRAGRSVTIEEYTLRLSQS